MTRPVKISVLSGKGGTGKTLVAVNLAAVAKEATYLDCDVEEPNGHLFFHPKNVTAWPVIVGVPQVNQGKCTGCRVCMEFCAYNALAWVEDRLVIFAEICHSCGGCFLLCPESALNEVAKEVGRVEKGVSANVTILTGILKTGVASGVPIIKELLNWETKGERVFIDCPPGSSCIVMETVAASDYCILVAEPTVFGVHNLNMVWQLVRLMGKPCGVVLNKCIGSSNPAEEFCRAKDIDIIGRIPFSSSLGKLNSDGFIAVYESQEYRELFEKLLNRLPGGVEQ